MQKDCAFWKQSGETTKTAQQRVKQTGHSESSQYCTVSKRRRVPGKKGPSPRQQHHGRGDNHIHFYGEPQTCRRTHSFHNVLLHEERPKTKETSQIISLPETICRSTEKLPNRPVTHREPLKRGDSGPRAVTAKGPLAILQPSCWACRQIIWSSQIAVATLQLAYWACRLKIWSSQIAVATLQLAYWACRQKTWSSQIAVATLQLAYWACRQKIWSRQIAVAILQPSYWACRQIIWSSQIAVAILQPSCWACRQKIWSSQIAVAILQPSCWAYRQKIWSSQIAVATLQLAY